MQMWMRMRMAVTVLVVLVVAVEWGDNVEQLSSAGLLFLRSEGPHEVMINATAMASWQRISAPGARVALQPEPAPVGVVS